MFRLLDLFDGLVGDVGCDDKQGKIMREKLGGELIVLHEGHMGSTTYNQPYKEFPLLLDLI
jgi:hypothetical protein